MILGRLINIVFCLFVLCLRIFHSAEIAGESNKEGYMDRKCSKCGGELVEGALLDAVTFHSVIFTPIDELNKIKKKSRRNM